MNEDIQRALEFIDEGRIDEGRFLLETLSPEFLDEDDRAEWACGLAKALIMGESPDTEGALEVLAAALRESPQDARLYLARGIVLSEANRLDEAERSFASAVRLSPDDWEVHLNRGIYREQVGRLEQAARSFKVAVKRAEGASGEPLVRLAWLYRRLERLEEAAEAFEAYLAIEPLDAQEWVSLAVTESELGRYDKAAEAYQQALAYEPGNVSALFNCAITAQRREDLEGLRFYVAELGRWAPRDRRTAWAQGVLLVEEGQIAEAARLFARVFRLALQAEDLGFGELGTLASAMFPLLSKLRANRDAALLMRESLQAFLFEEDLLEGFVESFGQPCHPARRFILVLDAADPDEMPDENGIPRHWRYRRRYEIVAPDEDSAWAMAADAERVIGGEELRRGEVIAAELLDGPQRRGILYMGEGNAYLEDELE